MTQVAAMTDRGDAILDAAFHAFAAYGYRRTTMEDIASGAGVSRTALYQHFRNKEDIFRSLSVRYFESCLAGMALALQDEGPADIVLQAAFAAKDGKFMEVVLGTPHGRELLDAGFALAADLAGRAEAQMANLVAAWVSRRRTADLGEPAQIGATVMAALRGLKSSARTLDEYRDGQAILARMLAMALER